MFEKQTRNSMVSASIAQKLAQTRERIARAAERVGRSPDAITLLAVTKTVSPERILEAYAAGVRDFGENYAQEARSKVGVPPLDLPDIRWSFIGRLQRNKAREVVGKFALIQSVDSIALAQEIGKRAQQRQLVADILLEVKLDDSEAKAGITPAEALALCEAISQTEGVRLCGLMGMAPFHADPEMARPHFRRLYHLFMKLPQEAQQTLSMGMTGDYEVAIEEGATQVRIGTALFGTRR